MQGLDVQHHPDSGRAWYLRRKVADRDVDRAEPGRPRAARRGLRARTGFTYSVLDGDEVIGCVLYPTNDHDVEAQSWVRASRAELDVVLWETVSWWLAEAWTLEPPLYEPRQ